MSDVFSSLCSFGRNKKKNSVVNSVTVVGVKKALLLGKISIIRHSISPLHFLHDYFLGLLSNNEERKGFDDGLSTEEEQTSDSSTDHKNTKTSCDFSNTR